ncbi:MAG: phosphatase PAP2 family protein, partial [Thermodesulfovibrionales bacterium]|nr:phosphatase PAP2 family protein [Thermodesulfovibrionales bacterium]
MIFKPSDFVTIFFSLVFTFLCAFAILNGAELWHLLVLYLSFALFQIFLVYSSRGKPFFIFLRQLVFPLVAVFSIFDSLTVLIPAVNPHDIDHILMRLDFLIFKGYPTLFMERFFHPLLSDILQISYSLYYFMPFILGIALKVKKDETAFDKSLFLVLLCFYLSYVGYVIFPALGPRYAFGHIHSQDIVDGIV